MEATKDGTQSDDARSTGQQAREKTEQLAGQASEQAQRLGSQAQSKVREQVDQRSTQAGEQVSSTASDIRSVGEQLRQQGKDTPARLAEQAANRTERFGSYLKEADSDRILSDVEDFGRRQPWAVLAGAAVAGLVAARFLKASSRDRYQRQFAEGGPRALPRRSSSPSYGTTPPPAPAEAPTAPTGAGIA